MHTGNMSRTKRDLEAKGCGSESVATPKRASCAPPLTTATIARLSPGEIGFRFSGGGSTCRHDPLEPGRKDDAHAYSRPDCSDLPAVRRHRRRSQRVDDRFDGRPEQGDARRLEGVFRRVLPPGQHDALPCRRIRSGRGQGTDPLDTFLARLQATKPEEIAKKMAEVVSTSERVTLIVGDRKVVESKLRAMGYSKIQPVTYDGERLVE